MDVWMLVLTVLSLILVAGGMLAAGIWTITRIQLSIERSVARVAGSIDKLSSKVDGLGQQVDGLTTSVNTLDNKLDSHSERITRLEAQNS